MFARPNCTPPDAFRGGVVFALVAVGWARSAAYGQAIEQYLSSSVPGYDQASGVTVTSRTHHEYDPLGVRVGLLVLRPDLSEAIGYDDNVTGTSSPRGSIFSNTSVRLSADYQASETPLKLALTADDWRYIDQGNQSYTNWTATAGGTHQFGEDTLTIAGSHLALNQTPRDLDVPTLGGAVAYRVDNVRATWRALFGRASLTPGLEVGWYNFDNGIYFNSGKPTVYKQDYRNRVVYVPSLQAEWELSPRRRAILVIRESVARFNTAPPVAQQDFNDITALAGLAYEVTGALNIRALGGFEHRDFHAANIHEIDAPVGEAALTWAPSGLTTIEASVIRNVQNSSSDETSGVTATTFRASVDHELYRSFILGGDLQYSNNEYSGSLGEQNLVAIGVTATWRVDRHWRATASYRHIERSSGFNRAPAIPGGVLSISDFTENLVSFTVTLSL